MVVVLQTPGQGLVSRGEGLPGFLAGALPPCKSRRNHSRMVQMKVGAETARSCPQAKIGLDRTTVLTAEPHMWTLCNYDHDIDYDDVRYICKDVYGGTDYMPWILPDYVHHCAAGSMLLLVARSNDSSTTDHTTDGIIGAELRGKLIYIFGLRVRETVRNKGLGHHLMDAVCKQALQQYGSVAHSITTTTVTYNAAAQRIISAQLPGPHHWVDIWPRFRAVYDYEQKIGWPARRADTEAHMFDHIPGAWELLKDAASTDQWTVASSLNQVQCCLRAVRTTQWQLSQQQQPISHGDDMATSALDQLPEWLPFFYEMFPADGPWAEEQVKAGRIWLLGEQAVMVLAPSVEGKRWTAGIVSLPAALPSALLLAAKLQPHFVAFIDRGLFLNGTVSSEPPAYPPAPAIYAATGGADNLITYGRRL